MAQVTIEGSHVTPSTFLAPGARITVEHTKYIANLIRRGYVNLVQVHEPIHESAEPIMNEPEPEADLYGAPPASASKSVWAAFLADKGISTEDGATKAEMIQAWESHGDDA